MGGGNSSQPGSFHVNFAPKSERDQSGQTMNFHSITYIPGFEHKSFEELRYEDTKLAKQNPQLAQALQSGNMPAGAGGGMIGNNAGGGAGGLFGNNANQGNAAAGGGGLFGNNTQKSGTLLH